MTRVTYSSSSCIRVGVVHVLHDLGHVSWVGSALYADPAQHLITEG